MSSPYDTSTMPCPYCQFPMEADWVDVGVGMVQCGPYHCENCNASQIGSESGQYDENGKWQQNELNLDADEKRTGFYKNRISPLANQYNGKPISHKQADAIYRAEYFEKHGNPYNAPIYR